MGNTDITKNAFILDYLAPADLKAFVQHGPSAKACGITELEECVMETVTAAVKGRFTGYDHSDVYKRVVAMVAQRVFDPDVVDQDAVNACSKFWGKAFTTDVCNAWFVAKGVLKA